MKIKEIIALIEDFAPLDLAEDNDKEKIGLQLGDTERECSGIVTCLDCTLSVVNFAVANGCNLIVSHHPTIYNSLQKIDLTYAESRVIELTLKNDVTVYSAHTNLDKSKGGINMKLISLFGGEYVKNEGCLFFADVKRTTLADFARRISTVLGDNSVKLVGNPEKEIGRFCVCSGGGAATANLLTACEGGADVYVTGDAPHHVYLFADENKYPMIEFSHYNSEIISEEIFLNQLSGKCGNIKILKANQRRPFRTLEEI